MRNSYAKKIVYIMITFLIILSVIASWNATKFSIEKLFTNASKNITVAVVDTGISLENVNEKHLSRLNLLEGECLVEKSDENNDVLEHGTMITNLILNNTTSHVSVMPINVVNSEGMSTITDLYKGVKLAADNNADIINISLNTSLYTNSEDYKELETLINDLASKGVYVIVSAGNNAEDVNYLFPANVEKAIVVSSVDKDKNPYFYANYGEAVDFCAAGIYDGVIGTSFSCAYVTSLCAEMMANGIIDIEQELQSYAYKPYFSYDEKYGKYGYIGWDRQYVGENETISDTYVGVAKKTENNLGTEILEFNWEELSSEELDKVLAETNSAYVGLFLSRLTEEQIEKLKEKSKIVNTKVSTISLLYNSSNDSYDTDEFKEIGFIDYCLNEYKREENSMLIISRYKCTDTTGTFYISSPDRKKIYKYDISGMYDYGYAEGEKPFTAGALSIAVFTYKDEPSSCEFTMPIPTSLKRCTMGARAVGVEYYYAHGELASSLWNWLYYNDTDDASLYYGFTVEFSNYTNRKTGYHNNANAIVTYNADAGVGTSTSPAKGKDHVVGSEHYVGDGTKFAKLGYGYMRCYYNSVLKSGYTTSNATDKSCLANYQTRDAMDVYFFTNESSINDSESTFSITHFAPWACGFTWYDSTKNRVAITNDTPEYCFALSPNTYTVRFNGNGSTGGSMADQAMTYDVGYNLNANGFTRTGYTFAGWSTSPNGSVAYSDGQYVSNMTSANGGVVNLYAVWTPNNFTMTLDHNGGAYYGATSNNYTVTYGASSYYAIAGVLPYREGYTFNGYWTADGVTQIYDANGYCKNDGTYWKDNIWQYKGNVTFVAQWIPYSHTLQYDANGGTGAPEAQTVTAGIASNISSTIPTRSGYTFKYWTTTPYDLTNDYHYGTVQYINNSHIKRVWLSYVDAMTIEVMAYVEGASSVLVPTWTTMNGQDDLRWYGLWEGDWSRGGEYFNYATQIRISEHNGEVGEYLHHIYAYNSSNEVLDNSIFRERGFIYHPNDIYAGYMNGGTQTLYAQWVSDYSDTDYWAGLLCVNHCIESLDGIWDLHEKINSSVTVGTQIALSDYRMSMNGFTYSHAEVNGSVVEEVTMPTGSLVVNLYYTRNSYKVALDKDSGISSVSGAGTYKHGETVTIDALVKLGYSWNCWNGDFSSTDKNYKFTMPTSDVTMKANTNSDIYKITLDNQGADTTGTLQYFEKYNIDNYANETCTEVISEISVPTKTGYTFGGYFTKKYGQGIKYVDESGKILSTPTDFTENTVLFAYWTPNTYEVYFDANGGDGTMEPVTFSYDILQNLPKNLFTRENEYGPSTFLGWSTDATATAATFTDEEEVMNPLGCEEGFLTLYAIWDDCPWIIAEDLYFSLYEAQNGLITYEELMSKAEAFDKEDGASLLPGIDTEKGTTFTMIDYLPTDFTQFTDGGSVTETYQAIDSAGNIFKKRITVHIVDTTPEEILPEGTTRFINEKYYNETYENGGLEDNSIWKTEPEYVAVIQEAFDNLKNNTPIMSFSFTYEAILEMKEFIGNNGFGNNQNSDALQRFYDTFMAPNMINSKEE